MRVTVCELRCGVGLPEEWEALVEHVKDTKSDLVLLPELPFYSWLPASKKHDPSLWTESVHVHDVGVARLSELGASAVLGTRPITDEDQSFNEGFAWHLGDGASAVHRKRYLPEEAGFWEASWYSRGPVDFTPFDLGGARIGFLICTDLWFFQHARDYGQRGAQILACPRATPASTVEKWLAGGRAAAIASGAFCVSSNRAGRPSGPDAPMAWGGTGWIIEPEDGEILGRTGPDAPFLTLDLDLNVADAAKSTYPRYVT